MVQYIITFIVLILAVVWAIKRIARTFHEGSNKCGGCEGCVFAEKCSKQSYSKKCGKKFVR